MNTGTKTGGRILALLAAGAFAIWAHKKNNSVSGIGGMSREKARKWLENRGYRVVYQMGSYPSPGFYMAIPSGPWGRTLRGSLNGIVEEVKRIEERSWY